MRNRAKSRVFRVTNAPKSLEADVRSREVRYLISMGIRTACFVLAFLASGTLRWALVVAAVVLPYIAVVIANAGRESSKQQVPTVDAHSDRPELPGGTHRGDVGRTAHSAATETVHGTVTATRPTASTPTESGTDEEDSSESTVTSTKNVG